jgi:hypothetical protein
VLRGVTQLCIDKLYIEGESLGKTIWKKDIEKSYMSSKMNYACGACGMASGRRESVQRHINNPRIHNGNAIAIPFVHYLAGLAGGAYPQRIRNPFRPGAAHGFRNPDEQQMKGSFFDRIQERVREKTIEKIAEGMVNHTSPSPPLSMPNITHPIQQPPFSYPGENIFGIGGYICDKCLVLKPIIFPYLIAFDDRSTQSLVYPVQFCDGYHNFGSPQEETDYIRYNKINGFPTALHSWIRGIWSKEQNMKLISLQIHGAKGSNSKPDDFNQPGPRLSNSSGSINSNPQIEKKGYKLRVIVEQKGLSSLKKSITLPYNDSKVIQLSAAPSIENHRPNRSAKVPNASILMAIENSEQLITSEDDLLSFLGYVKFKTFSFFGIGNESYLVMLIPEEYTLRRSYNCQLFSTS